MKHYIFYALLALMPVNTLFSAQTIDSATVSRMIEQSNKSVLNTLQAQAKPTRDSTAIKIGFKTVAATPMVTSKTVQDIITFLPVVFFIFTISIIFIKLRKDGVKLRDILIDKETIQERRKTNAAIAESHAKIAAAAANAVNANPNIDLTSATFTPKVSDSETPVQEPTAPEQSTSRLIVFICGITSIALACCITSFYFYKSFTEPGPVDLGNLANVLYGLGLGILPYGFNKIAAALK